MHLSLKTKAARNNLTVGNIRNIIRNVVTNEMVLAAVKSKADEMDQYVAEEKEKARERILAGSPNDGPVTRRKAQEMNLPPLKIASIGRDAPDRNLVQLVADDDPDESMESSADEEDDYQPNYDELSDDCSTATCSDVESQPRTPNHYSAANSQSEAEDNPPAVYDTSEGLFKLPQGPPIPSRSQQTGAEIIAKRTRSKVNLDHLDISTIQPPPDDLSVFQMPDIPDSEFDYDDEQWYGFLEAFHKPLKPAEAEDEQENDPEFQFNDDQVLEREECDTLVVTKREADLLLRSLTEEVELNVNNALKREIATVYEVPSSSPDRAGSSSPVPAPPSSRTRKKAKINIVHQKKHWLREPPAVLDKLTPVKCPPPPPPISIPSPPQPIDLHLFQGTDQELYVVPTPADGGDDGQQPHETALIEIDVNEDISTIVAQINGQRIRNYEHQMAESVEIGGWSPMRIRMFHRQITAYVQLLGQMFVQCFSHPLLWESAQEYKLPLLELRKNCEASPTLNTLAWNLAEMLEICQNWETRVAVESEENRQYVEELRLKRFHPAIIDLFLSNRAFLFPDLLPACAAVPRGSLPAYAKSRIHLLIMFLVEWGCTESMGKPYAEAVRAFQLKYGDPAGEDTYRSLRTSNQVLVKYFADGTVPPVDRKEMPLKSYKEAKPLRKRGEDAFKGAIKMYVKIKTRQRLRDVQRGEVAEEEEEEEDDDDGEKENQKPADKVPVVTMSFPNFQAQFSLGAGEDDDEGVGGMGGTPPLDVVKRKQPTITNLAKIIKRTVKRQLELEKEARRRKRKQQSQLPLSRKQLTIKLNAAVIKVDQEYDEHVDEPGGDCISAKLFNYFKEFDLVLRLLDGRCKRGEGGEGSGVVKLVRVIDLVSGRQQQCGGEQAVVEEELPTKPTGVVGGGKDKLFVWKWFSAVEKEVKEEHFKSFLDVLRGWAGAKESLLEVILVSRVFWRVIHEYKIYFILS